MAVAAAWCAALVGCWQETEPGDDGPGDPADPPPLATRTVPVRVRVPDGTPGAVWLDLLRFEDYWTDARVALADTGGGVWTGTVDLQDGALVRYVYDRWDGVEPLADAKDRYEASGDETRIDNRFALVGPGLALDDVVETWQDRRDLRAPLGDLAGVVLDAATGAPLVDAEVSAGGLHTATDVDGRFRLGAIAAGPQRVVVQGTLGEYVPAQVPVTVAATAGAAAGGAAGTEVVVETTAAEPVDVTFDAALPADTPADAEVRLIGNVYQAGARTFSTFPFHPDPLRAPVADRSTPGHARVTLALHAGTYVEYDWTIGGDGPGREARDQRRSFVVEAGADHEDRTDRVDAWVPDGAHLITWRLTTPPDTTAGAPIAIEMGPSHWMAPTGPSTWTFFMAARPGEQVGYRYVLGGDQLGPDVAGIRRITMPDHDLVLDDAVERWAGTRGAVAVPEGRPIAVTLRAALPTSTSAATPVRALGDGPLAAGVPLVVDAAQPSLRTAAVTVPAGVALHYHYEDGLGGR
ncbi:MAG TPA: hypothetical protein VHE35_14350, partial [Kofleriaceae bacterium]|nr:hypothetical protein [Kofleriaceae bacterium]